jgi:hypothetical protein
MEDTRPRAQLPEGKQVNLAQLQDELGGVNLATEDDWVIVADPEAWPEIDASDLAAAIEAHVSDPFWGLTGEMRRFYELAAAESLSPEEVEEATRLLLKWNLYGAGSFS